MDDAGEGPLPHLGFQQRHGVVVGVAGVDDQRQAGRAGGRDVGAKARGLPVARGKVVEIVEAALADGDDAGVSGELEQRCRVVEALLAGLVRVDADGAEHLGPALGQGDADGPARALGGDVDHSADAGRLGPLDHPGLVLGEARVVEVAVAVDDHACTFGTGICANRRVTTDLKSDPRPPRSGTVEASAFSRHPSRSRPRDRHIVRNTLFRSFEPSVTRYPPSGGNLQTN